MYRLRFLPLEEGSFSGEFHAGLVWQSSADLSEHSDSDGDPWAIMPAKHRRLFVHILIGKLIRLILASWLCGLDADWNAMSEEKQ